MSYRLRYVDVKAAVADAIGLCPTDTRVADYVNAACERLLYRGKWPGTIANYRVCVNESCLVWPRMLETIEAYAIDDVPGNIQNQWYEFLSSGPWLNDEAPSLGLIDQGEVCTFDWTSNGNRFAVYCDQTETATNYLTLLYWDENGNFVRKAYGGTWQDGERILFPAAGTYAYSTLNAAAKQPVQVYKPVTNGVVRLYEHNQTTNTYKALAVYEPGETNPTYRFSKIESVSTGDCADTTVTIKAKVRFIPVVADNDWVQIPNKDAVRLGAQAVKMEKSNELQAAANFWALAEGALQSQLQHYRGHGVNNPIRVINSQLYGGSGIPSIR